MFGGSAPLIRSLCWPWRRRGFLACGAPVPVFPRRVCLVLVFVSGSIGAVRGLFAVVLPRGSRPPWLGWHITGPGRGRRVARFVRGSLRFVCAARARLRLDCAVWLCAGALAFGLGSFARSRARFFARSRVCFALLQCKVHVGIDLLRPPAAHRVSCLVKADGQSTTCFQFL